MTIFKNHKSLKVFLIVMGLVILSDLIALYYQGKDAPLNPIMGVIGCIWFWLNFPVFAFWFLFGWMLIEYVGFNGSFLVLQVIWWGLLSRLLAASIERLNKFWNA
jgi:hypothetical protein